MLVINVSGEELFNEETQEFTTVEPFVLELEHSLISLSKWEAKFEKPFLSKDVKTEEEVQGYVEAMILNPIYPEQLWRRLSRENFDDINAYIESKQTGTNLRKMPERPGRKETITSELIYYWLVMFNIPFEVEYWHLNRLFALIGICNMKNSKPTNRSKTEIAEERRQLNAQRRAQLGTSG